jgi:hypothetical protein
MTPFEVLFGRAPTLPNYLESFKAAGPDGIRRDFQKNWSTAKKNLEKANLQSKRRYDSQYKDKTFEIGDHVRLHSPALKLGLKQKLRKDLWHGPFTVAGKLPNGNLKLNIGKKNQYIVHPNRLKNAETCWPVNERKKQLKTNSKSVSFSLH